MANDNLFNSAPLAEDEDPFGEDAPLPEVKRSKGFHRGRRNFIDDVNRLQAEGDPEVTGNFSAKDKKAKAPDHNLRTRDLYESKGYVYARSEFWVVNYQGVAYKKDLYGLFDGIALRAGRVVGVQIGGAGKEKEKMRELCDPRIIKDGLQGKSNRERLLAWLEAGGRVHVVCWAKPGRFWEPSVVEVTKEIVADVDSRRRKAA